MLHKISYKLKSQARDLILFAFVTSALAFNGGFNTALAVPPHPDLKAKIESGEIALPPFLKNYSALKARGVCGGSISNAPGELLKRSERFRSATIVCGGGFPRAGHSGGFQRPDKLGRHGVFRHNAFRQQTGHCARLL